MKIRFIGFLLALFMTGLSAVADDVADLIATSDAVVAQVNALDADGVNQFFVNGALVFGTNNPTMGVRDNDVATAGFEGFANSVDFYSYTLNNRTARVFGDTGLTASTVVVTTQFKGESIRRTTASRLLTTWSKTDGKWKIVGQHGSWFPSGKPPF